MRQLVLLAAVLASGPVVRAADDEVKVLGEELARYARPPKEMADDFGGLRSPLLRADSTRITTPAEWTRQRDGIRKSWQDAMGPWPPLLGKPKLEYVSEEQRANVRQHAVRVQTAPARMVEDAFLLVPEGRGRSRRWSSFITRRRPGSVRPAMPADSVPIVATVGEDRTVRLWQPTTGRLPRFTRLDSVPRAVVWSATATTSWPRATTDDSASSISTPSM
jgi:hypothetical protein